MVNLDVINDQDFDFLMDLTLDTMVESQDSLHANFDENIVGKIDEYLNEEKYDLELAIDHMNLDWWEDIENIVPEEADFLIEEKKKLQQEQEQLENPELASQEPESDNTAKEVVMECSLIATKLKGRNQGEKVVVISTLIKANNIMAIEKDGCQILVIQWLPELNNLNK